MTLKKFLQCCWMNIEDLPQQVHPTAFYQTLRDYSRTYFVLLGKPNPFDIVGQKSQYKLLHLFNVKQTQSVHSVFHICPLSVTRRNNFNNTKGVRSGRKDGCLADIKPRRSWTMSWNRRSEIQIVMNPMAEHQNTIKWQAQKIGSPSTCELAVMNGLKLQKIACTFIFFVCMLWLDATKSAEQYKLWTKRTIKERIVIQKKSQQLPSHLTSSMAPTSSIRAGWTRYSM